MSAVPLRLCLRISPLAPSIGELLAVGCESSFALSSSPATLSSGVKHKSFICNGYKKHGGEGGGLPSPLLTRHASLPRHAGTPAYPERRLRGVTLPTRTPATLILSYVYFIIHGHPGWGAGTLPSALDF
jgi:hypothetical protein